MARERTRRPAKDTTTEDYSPALGKTIQRLRKAYNMSLGELSEQSGVAKSIISQIERNETNPTIGTIWRLSRALDTSLGEVLKNDDSPNFIEAAGRNAIPVLTSQDGLCTLHIIGWLNVVEAIQWYDFHAKPGGVLESEPHQAGSVEHLSVLEGTLEVTVGGDVKVARQGETLRYRGDRDHKIVNIGDVAAHATMILMMKVPMAE
jgi:XRE family transcriptional regulator, regulator of sulfur utilization